MRRPAGALFLALLVGQPLAAAELPQAGDPGFRAARRALDARAAAVPPAGRPRNVILFIGDGMGPDVVTAIRIAAGQAAGGLGENHALSFEAFPHLALVKTWTTDAQTPDSAGTITAMTSGVRTRSGVIGAGPATVRGDCASLVPVTTLGELARDAGLAAGIVTTARITHATPAGFYAHSADRDWESDGRIPAGVPCIDIARQLTTFAFRVALGGGRAHFLPESATDIEGAPGLRADGSDLTAEWRAAAPDRVVVQTATELDAILADPPEQVLGLFDPLHMTYEADRATDPGGDPSLEEMTRAAITLLARRNQGYLLLVEGGLIDPALHDRDLQRALIEGMAFDRAVAAAADMTDPADTLILVTADHGHVMPPWARHRRGVPIAGLDRWRAGDNPPGIRGGLPPPSLLDAIRFTLHRQPPPDPPVRAGEHSPVDVALYAHGPMADLVSGTVEQPFIFHLIARALSLVPDP